MSPTGGDFARARDRRRRATPMRAQNAAPRRPRAREARRGAGDEAVVGNAARATRKRARATRDGDRARVIAGEDRHFERKSRETREKEDASGRGGASRAR
jgi:hypothetical protein